MEWVNYHKHNRYSNVSTPDCTIGIEDYIKRITELGHTTYSTVEHGWHGGMTAILEAYEVCKENNLKLLIGTEAYYVRDRFEKDKSNWHIVIMALNHRALRQLNKALSEANITGFYNKARVDEQILLGFNPDDFIITSACVGGIINDEETIKTLHDHFKDNFFLEIQSHNHPKQIEINQTILEYSEKYSIELIHGCDTHWITKQDKINRRIFLEGKKIKYGDEDSFENDYPTYDEIIDRYNIQGVIPEQLVIKSLSNTMIIKEKTDIFTFKDDIKMPTLFPNETHEQKMLRLKKILAYEFKRQYPNLTEIERKEYVEAIRFETSIIENTKMEDYFLDNYYIIKRAKELGGILTRTGRGSAVSFFNNKLLGFTEVDRVVEKVQLYPTRFMSESRILQTRSLPDCDYNLVDQEPFIKATKEILGEQSCYIMMSLGTMKDKGTFRNVCRAYNKEASAYNEVSKNIDAYRHHEEWGELIEISETMENVIESISPNPCGFLLMNGDIREEVGIIRVKDTLCAMIDKNTADKWKYLKDDFLIVSVWDIISKVYSEVGIQIDDIKSLRNKIENNESVWKLYEDGITATLNQCATESGKMQVMRYKPKSVEELTAFVAGIRPSFASMKDYLLDRKPFSYGIPEFDDLLKTSMNFVLYQENIMATLAFAGFPEDETYGLIKAISKKNKDKIGSIKQRFIDGFIAKTNSEDNAHKVWQIIEDASAYGFNSSHALSYAYDSLYGAYLKATYPLQYYAVTLNLYQNNLEETNKLVSELNYFGIKLSDIKFGYSKAIYSYDKNSSTVYKGLQSIKYLNETVANELYELSSNTYSNPIDLFADITKKTSANSRQINILIKLNFFSEFGNDKYLSELYETFSKRYSKNHKEKTKLARVAELKQQLLYGKNQKRYSISERAEFQLEYLGFISLINEDASLREGIITNISDKYATRWIGIYHIKNGINKQYKIKYSQLQELEIKIGDYVQLDKVEVKAKRTQVEGKWIDTNEKQAHIMSIKVLG